MRVLFFGTYDTRSHPRVGVLRDGLREHGHDVEECNVPLGLDTATRVSLLRQPWRLPLLAWKITASWAVLLRRAWPYRAAERRPDAVVVGYLGHFDVLLARRLFRREPIALDHLIGASETASDRGVDAGLRQRLLRGLDAAALSSADVVVVDTDEHLQTLPDDYRDKGVVVAVGAPRSWFDHAFRAPDDGPVKVVFFGLYTPLQGAPTIGAALALLADTDIEFTMIGTGQDLAATRAAAAANSRVRWVDWVPSTELPDVVGHHHLCLGIFGDGPKALRVVPNKVFQGAAAGCAIITSDTEPQRRVLDDAAVFVPPADAVALAAAIRSLAADPAALQRARAAASALATEAFTSAAVTTPLHDLLQSSHHEEPMNAVLPPLSPNGWMRWDAVERHLPAGPLDVVEVGCGQGGFGARLAQRYRYIGVEPDDLSFEVARSRVEPLGGEVRHGDRSVLPGGARYDLLVSFEVIEHIEDDVAELAAWAELLRPGGRLVLSTPAWQHRYGAADQLVGHFRRYDPDDMRTKLTAAGFVDVEVLHFGMPLGYALETGRNLVGRRRLAAPTSVEASASNDERSRASGRLLQPSRSATALAAQVGTWPFRRVQRWFPGTGPGLLAVARVPGATPAQPPT